MYLSLISLYISSSIRDLCLRPFRPRVLLNKLKFFGLRLFSVESPVLSSVLCPVSCVLYVAVGSYHRFVALLNLFGFFDQCWWVVVVLPRCSLIPLRCSLLTPPISAPHRVSFSVPIGSLVQSAAAQIVCYDDIGDSIEYKLNVVGICGARHVAVDFF